MTSDTNLDTPAVAAEWLNLDAVARVTVGPQGGSRATAVAHPWCADRPGEQVIEIRFHQPMTLRRLRVVFSEAEHARTQEFTVWASCHRGEQHRELIRQQFNFSPGGATREVEEYQFDVTDVAALHLRIVPSIDGRAAFARLDELRIACD